MLLVPRWDISSYTPPFFFRSNASRFCLYPLLRLFKWVETRLEETQLEDVLMPPEEVSSLTVDGYVAHPLFALVLLVEYTVR